VYIFCFYKCKSRTHSENQLTNLTIIHSIKRALHFLKRDLHPLKRALYSLKRALYSFSKAYKSDMHSWICKFLIWYLEYITYYAQNYWRTKIVYAKNISLHFWALESDMHSWICITSLICEIYYVLRTKLFTYKNCWCQKFIFSYLMAVAGSIFRLLSQTHISKREFKNGHILYLYITYLITLNMKKWIFSINNYLVFIYYLFDV